MRYVLATLVTLLAASGLHAGSLALTFDDGPRLSQHVRLDASEKNRLILTALRDGKVSSVLFVAGHLVDSAEGLTLVKAWGDDGHRLANHSYAHGYFNGKTATLNDFQADLRKNEALLGSLEGYTKWFRFPFLKEGDTLEKRDGARAFLLELGYRNGHVTIDASDWYYSQRLEARLRRDPLADLAPYREAYLSHLKERAQYYQRLAQRTLGRDVKHVLLLHHNLINALFLPEVIRMFRENGWTIVSPAEAFDDPVYQLQPDVLPAGESLLWSLAKEKGIEGLRYPGEDSQYEEPILDALGL